MGDTLVHRGPDDGHYLVSGPFGLAFRRLSIIDPEGGRQPLTNEDGDVALVLNGEIYNFRELRSELEAQGHRFRTGSDAETLVHGFEEHGIDFVQRLVGMYAFALVDRRGTTERLFLGRDRLGIKPLYWARIDGGIAFASEPKAILATGRVARELRPEALLDYLVQGYVGGEESAWNGIHRLPPSGLLCFQSGDSAAPVVERTWDLPLEANAPAPSGEEIRELLDRVVADRLVADVPLGAFLSGGIDSTAVVTSMARIGEGAPVVCSVGFEERSHDELELARETARSLGAIQHTEILRPDPRLAMDHLPWFYDEPLADPSTVPTFLVSKMAREHVTVALSGDGGDETFAGYRRYVHDVAENRWRSRIGRPGRALAGAIGSVYPRLAFAPRVFRARTFLRNLAADPARAYWRSVSAFERADAAALLAPDLRARVRDHDPFHAFEAHYRRPLGGDALYRAQYADFHTYLPDQILTKVDRASMAVSLEVRVPILDHRFVERFAPIPPNEKVRGHRGKHAFREALRGRLSGRVLDGAKRGFDTPLAGWIRGPLRDSIREALEELPRDWFDRDALLRVHAQHEAGRADHGRLLWGLFVLEHWRRRHGVRGLSA